MPNKSQNTGKPEKFHNRGGARVGAGRKKMNVVTIAITVPEDQLALVDELNGTRSSHYVAAMKKYLEKPAT